MNAVQLTSNFKNLIFYNVVHGLYLYDKKVTLSAHDLMGMEADTGTDLGSWYLHVVVVALRNRLQCYRLQCFDTVGWVTGRASGL